ncbi:Nif3-like dinuclear metal center hexameric protein [Allofustis seminis]|uniref:Nif3-like dinuclear metal center hexameric protein n=1 Tax=Allofustis seminis TaxID=166939 RepID=UPI000371B63D|nr:Nif3-like dinuclear metal center hexameric protein [Allofustis seminis]
MIELNHIITKIDEFAPQSLAEEWDPVGLSFGDLHQKVQKILVALDLDPITLQEAIDHDVDLVVTHHPLIFKPIQTLNALDSKRRLYIKLIERQIAVFSAHTNLDKAPAGMNEWLAQAIQLENCKVLCPDIQKPEIGYGRYGKLPQSMTIIELIQYLKEKLPIEKVRYNEIQSGKRYSTIAILGGSGADFTSDVLKTCADLYITGDISYHQAQDMLRDGLSFIDVGHYVESIFIQKMSQLLATWSDELDWNIEVIPTQKQKDVFKFL